MDSTSKALKNRKNQILNITVEIGDEGDKENEELGLAPEVDDTGGPGLEQGDDGQEVAELDVEPTAQGSNLMEEGKLPAHAPSTLAGKAKLKMMEMIKNKKGT